MMEKKISVCMAVYNGQKYIKEQLLSIFNQSREVDEVVICDDHSSDDTIAIVRAFISEHKLENKWHLYCNESTKGYPSNFYYAMSLCQGDIVFLADQDDVWEADKIKIMSQAMSEDDKILLLASAWKVMDKDGNIIDKKDDESKQNTALEKISVSQIFYKYRWPGMSICYRKEFGESVLEKVSDTKLVHDVALTICAAEKEGFWSMDCCLQYHRNHDENLAMGEHRFWKVLNKKRKIIEIERYLDMLKEIIDNPKLLENHKEIVIRKRKIMQERLQNLKEKRFLKILLQYLMNRDMIRVSTMVCDCLICFSKV